MVDRGVVCIRPLCRRRKPFAGRFPTIDRFVASLTRPDPRK